MSKLEKLAKLTGGEAESDSYGRLWIEFHNKEEGLGWESEDDFFNRIAAAADTVRALPVSSVTASDWIDVNEALPPNGSNRKRYLAYLPRADKILSVYFKQGAFQIGKCREGGMPVSHWMPMPLKPTEQQFIESKKQEGGKV